MIQYQKKKDPQHYGNYDGLIPINPIGSFVETANRTSHNLSALQYIFDIIFNSQQDLV